MKLLNFNARIKRIIDGISRKTEKKSIVFISFHKCATSFFSSYILKQAEGLEHVDYASSLYGSNSNISIGIDTRGKVYGVIRILDDKHPSYNFVNNFLSNPSLNKTSIIFWTRDPRDILVSMYYSFGFSHGFSNNPSIRDYQEKRRDKIQKMTIDEYVLDEAETMKKKFEIMQNMIKDGNNYILLSYEEMINDFDSFFAKLSKVISISLSTKHKIYNETRPQSSENNKLHKRSGGTGGYREKLKVSTVDELNKKLFPILSYFNYDTNN